MGDIEDLLKIKSFKIEFKFCEHPGKFADCNNMLIREGWRGLFIKLAPKSFITTFCYSLAQQIWGL